MSTRLDADFRHNPHELATVSATTASSNSFEDLYSPNKNIDILFSKVRLIIKIGSGSLVDEQTGLRLSLIRDVCNQVSRICQLGGSAIIVSSGAVAFGRYLLANSAPEMQAKLPQLSKAEIAEAAQPIIFQAWESAFLAQGLKIQTKAVTSSDLPALHEQLSSDTAGNLYILNGANYGDSIQSDLTSNNDHLAEYLAHTWNASHTVFLSNTYGILDQGKTVKNISSQQTLEHFTFFESPAIGNGGAQVKLVAAKNIAAAGIQTVITSYQESNSIINVLEGRTEGTWVRA
jgi:glutamate 5-kinase